MRFAACLSLALAVFPASTVLGQADAALFKHPPPAARPMTWMHWMNSNASKAGMTKDLEAMAAAGIGGALIFNIDRGIPDGKVIFNSPDYRAIIAHSVREAARLGLTLGVHNCDGWSSSGGPWVKVEDSMKRVVWSEAVVTATAGQPVTATLPAPLTRLDFYRDIALVAYPATAADLTATGLTPTLTASTPAPALASIIDRNLDDTVTLRAPQNAGVWLQLAYAQPFPAQSLTIEHGSRHGRATLLSSDDGVTFTPVVALGKVRTGKGTWVFSQSFPTVTARFFRIEFDSTIELRHLDLAADPRLPEWLGRSSLGHVTDDKLPALPPASAAGFTPLDQVRLITETPDAAGRLTLTLPAGTWRIMRFGYTTTAATNNPATVAGKGLECDKLNRAALDQHFAAYVGQLAQESGPLTGKSLRFSEIDSYEMGGQNWTEGLAEKFRAAKGYDLTPFLPLLAGRAIGEPATAEAVLRDFRDLICSLMVDNYYRRFTELCHQHGLLSYIEPYGFGPVNDLTVGGTADIPMGEFWMNLGEGSSFKSAVSSARTYGKPVISAESFTSWADLNWKIHPALMKYAGDFAWTQGINEMMFHRFAHQANSHVAPGMTMGNVGSHLDRTQTWWLNAGQAWFQYLQRGSHLLRQGVPVSDVLLYVGEASPHGVPEDKDLQPALPAGYSFDACDTEVLLHRLSVAPDGSLVLPEGTRYRVLALRNATHLSLTVLRRLGELATAGAIIAGPRPIAPLGYLELTTQSAEFTALARSLWGDLTEPTAGHAVGRGKIYGGLAWAAIFHDLALAPDFTLGTDAKTAFTHRRIGTDDVYFFLNQEEKPRTVRATFRVGDRVPELWHAATGLTETLAQFTQADGRTAIDFALPARGSAFVVFRQPRAGHDPITTASLDLARDRLIITPDGSTQFQTAANGTYLFTHASGRTQEIRVTTLAAPHVLRGAWQVAFDEAWGGPRSIAFPTLTDWKDHALDGIRHYSGSATYTQTFALAADWLAPMQRVILDLGRVEIAAEVTVNGRPFPTLWQAPFTLDITEALHAGDNTLSVRVTNLWTNRLIGDEAHPRTDGYTEKGQMPDWYTRNDSPPASQRRTFTTFNFHTKDKTLVPSGLLGPVHLIPQARVLLAP